MRARYVNRKTTTPRGMMIRIVQSLCNVWQNLHVWNVFFEFEEEKNAFKNWRIKCVKWKFPMGCSSSSSSSISSHYYYYFNNVIFLLALSELNYGPAKWREGDGAMCILFFLYFIYNKWKIMHAIMAFWCLIAYNECINILYAKYRKKWCIPTRTHKTRIRRRYSARRSNEAKWKSLSTVTEHELEHETAAHHWRTAKWKVIS